MNNEQPAGHEDDIPTIAPDEVALREALPATAPPVLLMSYVQLSGDTAFMERFRPHIHKVRDFADTIPDAMIAELHDRMVALLCGPQAGSPPDLDRTTLVDMMSLCVGEPVPEHYMPMVLSELGVERNDPAADFIEAGAGAAFPEDFRVAVIGGGLSGICAAAQLARAGLPFTLFEKNEAVGGTWWENKYPGCGVDTMNHWYSYSFAMNHDWSRYFVKRAELHRYLERCVADFDLNPHIRLSTRVESARWHRDQALWELAITGDDGEVRRESFNAVICGVGQLNNPAVPEIEGMESFSGIQFHSSRWPQDLDIGGKRVAMIGTGATGTQIGPAIAEQVGHLDIYQRSAHWVTGRANYNKEVEEGKKWALRHIPYYAKWYRFQILWAYGDGLYNALRRTEGWENPLRSIGPDNEQVRVIWENYLEQALADRPDLLEKSRPNFPPYGKRPLFDNNWFATLKRPNVSLIQDRIERIVPEGVIAGGALHPSDVIVFATGFQASKMVYSVDVTGVNGQKLRDEWNGDDPKAFLGSTVPGFPNFFLLYGPNTNLAHGGSIAFIAERQVEYAVRCLAELKRRAARSLDVRREVYERYCKQVDDRHAEMIWSVDGLDTWYKNRTGRVTTNSPWSLLEYWTMVRHVDGGDYHFQFADDGAAQKGEPAEGARR